MCLLITIYQGYQCTAKFFSYPISITDQMLGLQDLPQIQWTFCDKFEIGQCVKGKYFLYKMGYYDIQRVPKNIDLGTRVPIA